MMVDAFFNVSAKLRRCAMLQAFMHARCVHICIELKVHVMHPTASVLLCVFFFCIGKLQLLVYDCIGFAVSCRYGSRCCCQQAWNILLSCVMREMDMSVCVCVDVCDRDRVFV